MQLQIGLKLFSSNKNYLEESQRLFDAGFCQYVELYAFPGSYESTASMWREMRYPFIIHAPHFGHGMNPAIAEMRDSNRRIAEESFRFADSLKAQNIIFHPGVNGTLEESASQLTSYNDSRILIENKPYFGNGQNLFCRGATVAEMRTILATTGYGFCLDFGHAVCAANGLKIEPISHIHHLMELNPVLFHMTDGRYQSLHDRHDHYGKGNFPLLDFIKMLPENAQLTNEAVKDSAENLKDFEEDILYLRKLIGN